MSDVADALGAGGFRHLEYLMHCPSREICAGSSGVTVSLIGCVAAPDPSKIFKGRARPAGPANVAFGRVTSP